MAIASTSGGKAETGFTQKTHYNVIPGLGRGSESHKYAELMQAARLFRRGTGQPYIPIVIAGWDCRPWEGPLGRRAKPSWYYPDRTPEQFTDFLHDVIAWMDKHPDQTTVERIVLIYAWNEFGEGGYIAPTKGDPDGKYLKAIHTVLITAGQSGQPDAPADADKPRR